MTRVRVERKIGGRMLSLETGHLAKQADGAVIVTYGECVVLVTAQSAKAREGLDFFPLTVEYRERMSAGGKFPGGFIKREGRPSTREILTCRLTDRPIRPLFPEGYKEDLQIIGQLLSADKSNDPDVLNITGASAALSISSIPFLGPIGAVRVGLIDDEFVINPTIEERGVSELDLVIAGSRDAILMVEAGAKEIPEDVFVDAIQFGHKAIRQIVSLIDELVKKAGKPKIQFVPPQLDADMVARIRDGFEGRLRDALQTKGKLERYQAIDELRTEAIESETEGIEDEDEQKLAAKEAGKVFKELSWTGERSMIIETGARVDGRAPDEIRPISIDLSLLPRTHGSAVFTRGETQALVTTVLGTGDDEQRVENVYEDFRKRFYLDYNFPPFSVGEVRPLRGVGRRELGHGALAERALEPVLPTPEEFSYTVRIVSDILESNGSSSMATVCGGALAMMDAGVPIKAPVAGIAMGLVMDGDEYQILSDIAGSEDHNGDMDFKVAGTRAGITALQMDIKVGGLTVDILVDALEQARRGRLHILECMEDAIATPRTELSKYAPRLKRLTIPIEKIGLLIGPGGRQIKAIQETTGSTVEVDDTGVVLVSAPDVESVERAFAMVRAVTAEVEVGQVFDGKVVSIKDFGAFVEIAPGQEGLCHVSELDDKFVDDVSAVVGLGDTLKVKVIFVDPTGRIKLSRKAVLLDQANGDAPEAAPATDAPPRGGRGRPRDDDRPERGGRDRDDRPPRGPRSDRDDRPARAPRSDRDDRPARAPRSDRDDRPARAPRSDRDDRPARAPRSDRDDRPARAPRSDRDDRPARAPRSDRDDRPEGASRSDRDDRPARETSFDRDERPPRTDRRPRTESRYGRDRDDRPRGRGRDDEDRPRVARDDEDRSPGRAPSRDDAPPRREERDFDDAPPSRGNGRGASRGRGRDELADDTAPPERDRAPRGRSRQPERDRDERDDRDAPPPRRSRDDAEPRSESPAERPRRRAPRRR